MRTTIRRSLCTLLIAMMTGTAAQATTIYVYEQQNGSRLITDQRQHGPEYRLLKVYRHLGSEVNGGAAVANVDPLRPVPSEYDALIQRTAAFLKLDAALVKAVMHVESAFDKYALSHRGASGLMQLMPETARRYGVSSLFDPRQNLLAGARYLRDLLNQFDGDARLALAGYNAGENAVLQYSGVPPFPETQRYVVKVLELYRKYRNSDCPDAPSGAVVLACPSAVKEPAGPRAQVLAVTP